MSLHSDLFLYQGTDLYTALKLVDPGIQLILCGKTGHDDWDRYVLQECIQYTDMHSIHIYTCDRE
jgi:alpha-L-arabinofuranosidase